MKTILVPIENVEMARSVLDTALLAGRKFATFIEGFHTRNPLSELVRFRGPYLGDLGKLEEMEAEHAKEAREVFEAVMNERGIPWSDEGKPTGQLTAGWTEQVGIGDTAVGEHARLFDLIVVQNDMRPVRTVPFDRDRLMDVRTESHVLQTMLFESGRPILVAPSTSPETLGDSIVIAWNCSVEAARTTTFAMPLLHMASKIVLITVEDGMVPGPSRAEAVEHLRRNGIETSHQEVRRGSRSVGEAILETAAEAGANLLIKSAYTHSRIREFVFGGGTSHILKEADLPVFMAH